MITVILINQVGNLMSMKLKVYQLDYQLAKRYQEEKIEVLEDKLEKNFSIDKLTSIVKNLLNDIQFNLYNKANIFLEKNTHSVDKFDDFQKIIKQGGFILAHWDGTEETEMKIKKLARQQLDVFLLIILKMENVL